MMKKIVTIGGGSGTFNLLVGLKKYDYDITAVVSMTDSGGSNKVIRDEFGLLPTSDIRQSLVALADEKDTEAQNLMRRLFMYRFDKGEGIKGMTFGNLFMAALADILGDQAEAIKKTGDILKIKGRVIPVTGEKSDLAAIYENGLKIKGEHNIDEPKHDGKLKIKKIRLDPPAPANPEAIQAVENADLVIIGPGDLYTSLLANVVVDGMAEALKNTKAKIVYALNLMTSFGETYGFKAGDFIKVMESYLLNRPLDYIIVNSSALPPAILEKYKKENNFPVEDDLKEDDSREIIRGDFLNAEEIQKNKADVLRRSLIRHDGNKIAEAVNNILIKQNL